MPNFCAVVGCGSRGDRDRNSFFRIPAVPSKGNPQIITLKTQRRIRWILALRRKDLTETKLKYALICDRHFISGRPAATRDIWNCDWVPSLEMGYSNTPESPQPKKQDNSKDAIICFVTANNPEQVQVEETESEMTDQDENSQSENYFISPEDVQTELNVMDDRYLEQAH